MSDPRSSLGASIPLVQPLYQSSVYTLPDLDALDRIMNAEEPGYIYARDAHPNGRHLAALLAPLEEAEWALVTSSGMSALSAIFLATLSPGQRVVASTRLYGRTTQLLSQELARYGVKTEYVDTNDLAAMEASLGTPTRLVLVETLSNPLLRVADIPALAKLSHAAGARLVVDNTFATPVLTRPLAMGADLVMESLTKMIGGHSDITLGLVAGRDDLLQELTQVASIWGLSANPFDCWLTERGLATLDLRMHAATRNAAVFDQLVTKAIREDESDSTPMEKHVEEGDKVPCGASMRASRRRRHAKLTTNQLRFHFGKRVCEKLLGRQQHDVRPCGRCHWELLVATIVDEAYARRTAGGKRLSS